jgi:hypothetical protein
MKMTEYHKDDPVLTGRRYMMSDFDASDSDAQRSIKSDHCSNCDKKVFLTQ